MTHGTEERAPTLVVVNPAAGSGKAGRSWAAVSERLRSAGVAHDAVLTQRRGDATEIVRAALGRGVRRIVSVGGDGTLNEVANGFFTPDGTPLASDAALGVLPLGTGSDVSRSLGIGKMDRAIAALAHGTTRAIDVGRVCSTHGGTQHTRVFINVADAGIGADTAARVNKGSRRFGAVASYLQAAVASIMAYEPSRATIAIDELPPVMQPASIVVVANMRYFGGGMLVAPYASESDGTFDLLWLGGATKRRLLLDLLPRVYVGRHIGHPQVQLRAARTVTLDSNPPLRLEIDGEQWGTTPATFTLVPRALNVVVPPEK